MAEEQLVVEVVAAQNLMPKDGQGSSSAFVEVEFERQKLRTGVKPKELNPVWNERLVFPVSDPADLPYRFVDVAVYNDKASPSSRNFLGRVRFSAAGIPSPGEDHAPQVFSLEKRSLFSHIRGDVTLDVYRTLAPAQTKPKEKPVKQAQKLQKAPPPPPAAPPQKKAQPQQKKQEPAPKQKQSPAGPTDFKPGPAAAPPARPFEPFPGGGVHWPEPGLKQTSPQFGGGRPAADLVEPMEFLYVKVVKARGVSHGAPHVEVKLGNYRGLTKASSSLVWDQVFAFSSDCLQSSAIEIFLKEKEGKEEYTGSIAVDLAEIPRRAPPDSPLAPHWFRLESNEKADGGAGAGELMLAIWFGTQADECFSEAWHSSSAGIPSEALSAIKSKVYLSPKLWYLRVRVLEAQNLSHSGEVIVKAQVGAQVQVTRLGRSILGPAWLEDMLFVVAEPFEESLTLSLEDRGEVLGRASIAVSAVDRRITDDRRPGAFTRWLTLEGGRLSGRLHVRASLDGGYHVLDEATAFASDLRATTANRLSGGAVGVLELGVLGATGLAPVKTRPGLGPSADAYCVAKYGPKWVRTRTVIGSLYPRWNEQYQWEVFDPCTVLTVAVFDNARVSGGPFDARIGRVRIRLSTLESDRVYAHCYPLLAMSPAGVKKMGELQLAVRFSCCNPAAVALLYLKPLLPKMHYIEPIPVQKVELLRHRAGEAVAARLARAEPPLGREVVEYVLDRGSELFSMRRSKAHFLRLVSALSVPAGFLRWVAAARNWQHPASSAALVFVFLFAMVYPELILPAMFLAMAVAGLLGYRRRPRQPASVDVRMSQAEVVSPDEVEEEMDGFPSSVRSTEVLQLRYDRLRSVAMRVQAMMGDVATQLERCEAVVQWRDPRATAVFLASCGGAALVFYVVPVRVVVALWGVHFFLPSKFRSRLPSPIMNFFKRLPSKADSLL